VDPRVFRTVTEVDPHAAAGDTRVMAVSQSRRTMIWRWERFWFAEVPSEVFAFVRIAVGAVGFVSLVGATPVEMFWSPDGIAPLPGGGLNIRSYVLDAGLGLASGWVFFLILCVSFMCVTTGLFTSAAVMICFVGSLLQMRWNALPLTSGHGLLVNVLFYLIWADCGSRLSIDERRRRRRHRDVDVRPTQPVWPLRLIQTQVAMIYAASGLFKLLQPMWRDGSAVYYTTSQNIYGRIFHVYALPTDFTWALTILTYATVLWEISFPFLLLNRITRWVALATGVAMHLGIWATMEVGPFTWMVLASYVAFLNPQTAQRLACRRWRGARTQTQRTAPTTLPPSTASTA
jgi:hypothetical protein